MLKTKKSIAKKSITSLDPDLKLNQAILQFNTDLYIIPSRLISVAEFMGMPLLDLLQQSQQLCNFNFEPDTTAKSNFVAFTFNGTMVVASAQIYPIRNSLFEIWNVCSTSSTRGYGTYFMSLLIKYIKSITTTERYVWLGVLFKNPDFEKATGAYINVGFKYPHIETKSPSGSNLGYHVGLYLDINMPTSTSESFKKSLKSYALSLRSSTFNKFSNIYLDLNSAVYKKIIDSLDQPYEVGGSMFFTNIQHKLDKVLLGHKLSKVSMNSGPKDAFEVNVKPNRVNYHTHPRLCNSKLECSLLWPSGEDMIYLLEDTLKGLHVHFVFSPEGTYIIQASTQFKEYVNKNRPKGLDVIINSIGVIFNNLEAYRKKDKVQEEYLNVWLELCNDFTAGKVPFIEFMFPSTEFYTYSKPNVWNKINEYIKPEQIRPGLLEIKKFLTKAGFDNLSLFLVSYFKPDEVPFATLLYNSDKEFPSYTNSMVSSELIKLR